MAPSAQTQQGWINNYAAKHGLNPNDVEITRYEFTHTEEHPDGSRTDWYNVSYNVKSSSGTSTPPTISNKPKVEIERYKDNEGNIWQIDYSVYQSTKGNAGDYDEVVSLKKNGVEVGHITYHYDKDRRLKQRNEHGNINLPPGAQKM